MPALLGTRRVPYLGGAWTPARLPGLVLWLDAGGIGQADNTSVASWRDRSGHGNDATQGTVAHQPTYRASGINGRPAVQGDGVDDILLLPAALALGATPSSAFAVTLSQRTGSAATQTIVYPGQIGLFASAGGFTSFATYNGQWVTTGTTLGSPSVVDVVAYSIASLDLVANGVVTSFGNGISWDITANTGLFGITGQSSFYAGLIGTALVWNRALSLTERRLVEAYLGGRYGITTR